MSSTRDERLDILKGIGILLMVMGHCGAPGKNFIYLFHMALFFMASGYVFKDDYTNSVKTTGKYIGKRIKTLYLVYVAADTIFNCLNNFFLKIGWYASEKIITDMPWGEKIMIMPAQSLTVKSIINRFVNAFKFRGSAQFGMALWFIQALFGVAVLYGLLDFVIKKLCKNQKTREIVMGIISIACLVIGYLISKRTIKINLWGFEKSVSYLILFYLGYELKIHKDDLKRIVKWPWLLCVIGLTALGIGNQFGRIELSANSYKNPIFLIAMSLAGWFLVYGLSEYILKLKWLAKILILCGQNTFAVVILHFLCFKLVNYLVIVSYGLPMEMAAAIPTLTTDGMWWILYTIAGTGIPVAINICKKNILRKITLKKQ